jgi:hypothetical protein
MVSGNILPLQALRCISQFILTFIQHKIMSLLVSAGIALGDLIAGHSKLRKFWRRRFPSIFPLLFLSNMSKDRQR